MFYLARCFIGQPLPLSLFEFELRLTEAQFLLPVLKWIVGICQRVDCGTLATILAGFCSVVASDAEAVRSVGDPFATNSI
jgi:hypothetical protein